MFIIGARHALGKLEASLCDRKLDVNCFPVFWIVVILYFESHIIPKANKINAIFFAVILVVAEGIKVIGSIKGIWRYMLSGLVGGIYLVCFLRFGQYYYGGQYTAETHPLSYFDTLVAEGVAVIEADEELRQKRTYMAEDFI